MPVRQRRYNNERWRLLQSQPTALLAKGRGVRILCGRARYIQTACHGLQRLGQRYSRRVDDGVQLLDDDRRQSVRRLGHVGLHPGDRRYDLPRQFGASESRQTPPRLDHQDPVLRLLSVHQRHHVWGQLVH